MTEHQHYPSLEGRRPQADGVGTICKQRDAIVPTLLKRNRTKGSPYSKELFIREFPLVIQKTEPFPVNYDLNKRAKDLRKARNLQKFFFGCK